MTGDIGNGLKSMRKVRLEELVIPFTGFWGSEQPSDDAQEFLVLGVGNVTNEGELNLDGATKRFLRREEMDGVADEGDLVVVKSSGSAANIRSGKTAICPAELSGKIACSNFMMRLRVKRELGDPYLLWLILNSQSAKEFVRKIVGASTYPNIKWENYRRFEFEIPSLEEQRRIAARLREQLSVLTEARAALEAQFKAAAALPAANLRAVFESEEANHWPRQRIDEFAETCSGTTPPRGNREYYNGKVPWVKTGELKDGFISETAEHVSEAAIKDTSLKLLPKKTLLVAMYGQGQTRGRTGLLGVPATTNQACFAILPNSKFEPEFLQYWFRSSYERLRRETEGRGGNQPNLNGVLLNRLSVPLPPLETQHAMASRLDAEFSASTALRESIRAKLSELEKLPAALLRTAFNPNGN